MSETHSAAPHSPTDVPAPDPRALSGAQPETVGTGHAGVDAVVASLGALDEAPLADHVAVFEQAHDSLRRALDEAGAGAGTRAGAVTDGAAAQR